MKQRISYLHLIVAGSCLTLLCFAVVGVDAQKRRPSSKDKVTRKPAAPTPTPTPVPSPSPVPTPPTTPCSWCEPLLNVLEKGARWQTLIELPDDSTPSEVTRTSGGKPIAALVISGEEFKSELTIDRATGVGGPVEIMLALKNEDFKNAMTVGDSSSSWQAWMEHVAYRVEQRKLYAFMAFFDRAEFQSGRVLRATLTLSLNPATVRELGKGWKRPPR